MATYRRRRRTLGDAYSPEEYSADPSYNSGGLAAQYDLPGGVHYTYDYGNYVGDLPLDAGADGQTQSVVDRIRSAAQEFARTYRSFQANQADAIALGLEGEYGVLADRALTAQSYIQQVADAVQGAWGWTKQVFGLAGARLGILPAIPIAYVALAGILAWIVSVTTDMVRFNHRVAALRAGVDPEDLDAGGGTTGDMASLLKWGVIGIVAAIALPPLLQAMNSRRER